VARLRVIHTYFLRPRIFHRFDESRHILAYILPKYATSNVSTYRDWQLDRYVTKLSALNVWICAVKQYLGVGMYVVARLLSKENTGACVGRTYIKKCIELE
jgi:hypothetical protein